MRATLVAIIISALFAGLAGATPGQSLSKRKVKKNRDAAKAMAATQPTPEQAAAAANPNAPGSKPASAQPSRASAPTAPTAPVAAPVDLSTVTSNLSRTNKPPSTRFHSRVRSDVSREAAKKAKVAATQPGAATQPAVKKESYRKTWGPRSRNRRK